MNDILARRARRATMGIALSVALAAGIAPATAIAAETSSPVDAVVLQTAASSETAATEKEKAYAAMQEALKNLEATKEAASPEKIARFNNDIARFQEYRDKMLAQAAESREPLPAMQADIDAAQAKYDEAGNRVSELQAKLDNKLEVLKALEALGDEEPDKATMEHIKQLRREIMAAKTREKSCEDDLHHYQRRLESQEKQVQRFESEAEEAKARIDEDIAKRNALTDDLEKAQAAYDDACKAYEEAKAAADKATSPEITQPTETTPPSGSTQPAETTQPAGSPATGKDAAPSPSKQANTGNGKEAKARIDEDIAKRNALTDDLEKAQAAYDDACKAYEEAKAAADKATSPEITQPTETTPPSGSTQPAETTQPAGSPAAGKDTAPSPSKQANTGNGKQANTTAGKLANTGDTTPSAIALAGIAAAGLGITATATRRIKNSK